METWVCYDSSMQIDTLEPTRVFRTAAWIWIGYLASLAFVDLFIYVTSLVVPPDQLCAGASVFRIIVFEIDPDPLQGDDSLDDPINLIGATLAQSFVRSAPSSCPLSQS